MDHLTLSCPACAQPVGEDDQFCEVCGVDLRSAGAARAGAGTSSADSSAPAAPQPPSARAPGSVPAGAPARPDPRRGGGADAHGSTGPDPASDAALEPSRAPGNAGGLPAVTGHLLLDDADEDPEPGTGPDADDAAADGDDPEHTRTAPNPVVPGPACSHCGARLIDVDGYCESCGRPLPRPRDHQERALGSVAGVSDRGHRHHRNEDAFSVAATRRPDGSPAVVAVVCDGVSSASAPDEASELAAETAADHLLGALEAGDAAPEATARAILAAAEAVDGLAERVPVRPGHNSPACTCVSAVLADGRVTLGWVGDSRAYWIPDDDGEEPIRLTVDDSWAARMVEAGLMEEAEAYADPRAHAITGWLGADAVEVEPHTATFRPSSAGVVLVCTDGLWNYAEAAGELAAVVPQDARTRPLEAARDLVRFALENGGHDNVTVAVLPWVPAERKGDEGGHDDFDTDTVDVRAADDSAADAETETLPGLPLPPSPPSPSRPSPAADHAPEAPAPAAPHPADPSTADPSTTDPSATDPPAAGPHAGERRVGDQHVPDHRTIPFGTAGSGPSAEER